MHILLLGATGRTGKHIVHAALAKGHSLHCVVRDASKLDKHEQIIPFVGNPTDKGLLEKAMKGCDAMISALNISRTSDFPWAPLRTPPTLMSDMLKTALPLLKKEGIKRVVICSAWGAGDSLKDIPFWFRWTIQASNIQMAYQDHERQEEILTKSDLDWTIVRPVGLTPFKGKNEILESEGMNPQPNLIISRHMLGSYLSEAVERDDLIGKIRVVSQK
ncbi:MAG: NAD(P)H-binding protein [Bacteroidota bacterium]